MAPSLKESSPAPSVPAAPVLLPCSAVIATRHRADPLRRTLDSLLAQDALPSELLVIDGSDADLGETARVCRELAPRFDARGCRLAHHRAALRGAAPQRNEGVALARERHVLFLDDDILLEPRCLARLHAALESDERIGGASAMITNQRFERPGVVGRLVGWLVSGSPCDRLEWAGRYLAPGLQMLPADDPSLPDAVPVEWINAGCTVYRREALPVPPFPDFFTGASVAEDFTLSRIVRKHWRLVNARTARIFHDSQPGEHKKDPRKQAAEVAGNWLRIMDRVTGETRRRDRLRLAVVLLYRALGNARNAGGLRRLASVLSGYRDGWKEAAKSP